MSLLIVLVLSIAAYADVNIVAKVNGAGITAKSLEDELDALIPRSSYHGSLSEEKRNQFREKALNNLVERELQYQAALAAGLKPEKKAVKDRLAQVRDRFKSKKDYKAALKRSGWTEDELEEQIARAVVIESMIEKTVAMPSRLSDAELKDYFEKNMGKFVQPESVKLRIISAKDEKKAAEALVKIRAGADFGSVAEAVSEDQYRVKGGAVGYQHRGKLLPELEKAAFALKPGELSGLIQAEQLWFIIKVEDKKSEQQMTFAESKDKLKKELETKRVQDLREKWMSELKAKAKIEYIGTKE